MNNKHVVLIVEDEEVLLMAMTEKLQHEGYEVLTADNGEKGLESAIEHQPDIILLDILMPKMDGLTMMKKLREYNTWGSEVPILVLTNFTPDDEAIQQVTKDKPAYYLMKSNYELVDIVKKINEILSK